MTQAVSRPILAQRPAPTWRRVQIPRPRALRKNPALRGKLVLKLTIAPSGQVTDCLVVSSELGEASFEKRLIARVKMFRFEAKDVATVTTTKPIDFFPA